MINWHLLEGTERMFYLSSLRLAFIRKSWGDNKMSELRELLRHSIGGFVTAIIAAVIFKNLG